VTACATAAAALPSVAGDRDGFRQLATLIDITKCVGCEQCVYACREANADKFPKPVKPFPKMYPSRVKAEDWSEKKDVTDRLTPYNLVYIQRAEVRVNDETATLSFPRRCMHCVTPPCVKLCPWGAATQDKRGISRIDPDICLGGSKCRQVCPWEIPQRQTGVGLYLDLLPAAAGNGVMYKCDRCYDRIAKGLIPACIEACPEDVQAIGPRDEIIARARKIAEETNGYLYGETENGGTNTIYVSPVPFEVLNEAVEVGPGRPHLGNAPDAMAGAEKLTAAMIIAPVAGIAAALGKLYKFVKSDQ
jgi:Fe-S-cluster-containing dehydrogenase component